MTSHVCRTSVQVATFNVVGFFIFLTIKLVVVFAIFIISYNWLDAEHERTGTPTNTACTVGFIASLISCCTSHYLVMRDACPAVLELNASYLSLMCMCVCARGVGLGLADL